MTFTAPPNESAENPVLKNETAVSLRMPRREPPSVLPTRQAPPHRRAEPKPGSQTMSLIDAVETSCPALGQHLPRPGRACRGHRPLGRHREGERAIPGAVNYDRPLDWIRCSYVPLLLRRCRHDASRPGIRFGPVAGCTAAYGLWRILRVVESESCQGAYGPYSRIYMRFSIFAMVSTAAIRFRMSKKYFQRGRLGFSIVRFSIVRFRILNLLLSVLTFFLCSLNVPMVRIVIIQHDDPSFL